MRNGCAIMDFILHKEKEKISVYSGEIGAPILCTVKGVKDPIRHFCHIFTILIFVSAHINVINFIFSSLHKTLQSS